MVDYLANQVMDKRTSTQVQFETLEHDTTRWQRLTEYVGGDVGHWMLNNGDAAPMGGASVIPQGRRLHGMQDKPREAVG
ncbi:hypothetical protein PI124_g2675 [Phytophthora idaei]|nr:hypothetical protein PI126_g7959 [Phytophthora idaei]KAG3252712.1 hypothetical protein PI124_g2675 [Phytophthora idaei]